MLKLGKVICLQKIYKLGLEVHLIQRQVMMLGWYMIQNRMYIDNMRKN